MSSKVYKILIYAAVIIILIVAIYLLTRYNSKTFIVNNP